VAVVETGGNSQLIFIKKSSRDWALYFYFPADIAENADFFICVFSEISGIFFCQGIKKGLISIEINNCPTSLIFVINIFHQTGNHETSRAQRNKAGTQHP
jgi:hypothetical protein